MNGTMEPRRLSASCPNPLGSWSDEKLLLSYRAERDGGVFEELVRRYEKELFGYLRHYLGNAEMAEDVFQQTFLQVHVKCQEFQTRGKVPDRWDGPRSSRSRRGSAASFPLGRGRTVARS